MELALILGEPHTTVHGAMNDLLDDSTVGRVSYGTVHLPSSRRYYLVDNGKRETARLLDFVTPSDFVRAYPMSGEWLTLLIRRMDAVASVYRLAVSPRPPLLPPQTEGEHPSEPPHTLRPCQRPLRFGQGLLPPPQMVLPA